MEKQAFLLLVEKYLNDTASDQEKHLVEEYYRRMEGKSDTGLFGPTDGGAQERVLQKLRSRLHEEAGTIPIYRRPAFRAAAAAAIIGMIGFFIYFLMQPNAQADFVNNQPDEQQNPANENAIGSNRALLTLGDGSSVVLDDQKDGVITREGSVSIVKTDYGQIDYHSLDGVPSPVLFNTLSTPRGGQFKIRLPDGTLVWLNAASSLRYPTLFEGAVRQVEITGEAYFEVAKNASMPFLVKTGGMEIEVIGTHFNVMAYPDENAIKTTLLEGSVKVSARGAFEILRPGQQASLKGDGKRLRVEEADTARAVAWTTGFFEFENMNIYEVMRQISRWYDVEVHYETKDLNRKFGGRMSRNLSLENVLSLLKANDIRFRVEGKKIIVAP